jgi:hypothetical protein
MGAPMHTLMIPRGGAIHQFKESDNAAGQLRLIIIFSSDLKEGSKNRY